MHELPQLGKLERRRRDEVVIIGVQSPKYTAEASPENLRHAVERLSIEHPVVNDPQFQVWDSYAVRAWPTLVFISPTGEVIGQHAGEAPFEALDEALGPVIEAYERAGQLSREPLDLSVHQFSRPSSELSFPGKVLAHGGRLYIADSDHHRLVVADTEGTIERVIGTGDSGLEDGAFATARFYRPQGMALDSVTGILYVADSENHAIRAIDLTAETVTTVAGTGQQAYRPMRRGPATTPLSSPWDLALDGDSLYIAMAGLHQVWVLDRPSATASVFAGTGHEGIRDGSRESAWLAQPMGLSLDGRVLYVSCAETQSVRRIDLTSDAVETLVGRGLFDFGDADGPAARALLQHNQGVAAADGTIYIADTYNNKIKTLDETSRSVATLLGSGKAGALDGPGAGARFDEPCGLSLDGDALYIADTNNHHIRVADLSSGHVRTLRLASVEESGQ